MPDELGEELKSQLEEVLKGANNPEAARNIVAFLFPAAERSLKTYWPRAGSRAEQRILRRISNIRDAYQYFQLNPDERTFSEQELRDLTQYPSLSFEKMQAAIAEFTEEEQSELRQQFVEYIGAMFEEQVSFDDEWLNAIITAAPALLEKKDMVDSHLFPIDNFERLRWVIISGLKYVESQRKRAEMFQAAISNAVDISILCAVFRAIAGDLTKDGGDREVADASFGPDTESIRNTLLGRVRRMAEIGQIWSQARPDVIIWFWWGCDRESEVRSFLSQSSEGEPALQRIMAMAIGKVLASGGSYETVSISSWGKLLDLPDLVKKAEKILESSSPDDQILANRFINAVQRGQSDGF